MKLTKQPTYSANFYKWSTIANVWHRLSVNLDYEASKELLEQVGYLYDTNET